MFTWPQKKSMIHEHIELTSPHHESNPYLDVTRQCEESILDINGSFGRGLHELDPILDRQLLTSLFGNLEPELPEFLLFFVLRVGDCCGHFMELKTTTVPAVSNLSKVGIKGEWFKVFSVESPVFGHSCHTYFQESSSPHPHWHAPQYSGSSS